MCANIYLHIAHTHFAPAVLTVGYQLSNDDNNNTDTSIEFTCF